MRKPLPEPTYLLPEEQGHAEEYLRFDPRIGIYARLLAKVHKSQQRFARSALCEALGMQWNDFARYDRLARARHALMLTPRPNGDMVLIEGETFQRQYDMACALAFIEPTTTF